MCIDDGIFACRVFHSQAEDIGFSPLSLGTQSLKEYIFNEFAYSAKKNTNYQS